MKLVVEANVSGKKYHSLCAAGALVACLVAGVLSSTRACVWIAKLHNLASDVLLVLLYIGCICKSVTTTNFLHNESMCLRAGNREAAQELTGKGKEHAHLAKEARQRANQAAYDSCNVSVTNRFKVRSCRPVAHCSCGIKHRMNIQALQPSLAVGC